MKLNANRALFSVAAIEDGIPGEQLSGRDAARLPTAKRCAFA